MCRESYRSIQDRIRRIVGAHGGVWVTTISSLKQVLQEEHPDMRSRQSMQHPLVGLGYATGLVSVALSDQCREVVVISDPQRTHLYYEVQEDELGEDVMIALLNSGLSADVETVQQMIDERLGAQRETAMV